MIFNRKAPPNQADLEALAYQTRIRRKFLLIPRTFIFPNGDLETRWLCFANIVEQVKPYSRWNGPYRLENGWAWFEIGFGE